MAVPTYLTSAEIDRTKELIRNGDARISDYRNLAVSARSPADVQFLCDIIANGTPREADWALTASFYFGGVVGIGETIAPWLERDCAGSAIDTFAPAVLRRACIQTGDATAARALESRGNGTDGYVRECLDEARQFFKEACIEWDDVLRGALWERGAYLRRQLLGEIEALNGRVRIAWFLKHSDCPEVQVDLQKLAIEDRTELTALHVLISFMGREDLTYLLLSYDPPDGDRRIVAANVAYSLLLRNRRADVAEYLAKLQRDDESGRIAAMVQRVRTNGLAT